MAATPLRLLVTGKPGVGKTTLLERASQALPEELVTGFLCRERRDQAGQREAFEMVSLRGGSRGVLASVHGPSTGKRVGKYHVQIEDFERLALPILDAALAGGGGPPRAFIFDEIGKMELNSAGFVQRVRCLLTSPDPSLHVLGTVAEAGAGFIAESKSLSGVEVVEINHSTRDARREEVMSRLQTSLGIAAAPSSAATADRVAAAGSAAAAATAEAAAGRGGEKRPRARFDQPLPGQFSAVYLPDPDANFASVNAGDYMLYVGGAAINKAFFEALRRCGQSPGKRYEQLNTALLDMAAAQPGSLHWVGPDAVGEGALSDSMAFCGLLPEGDRMAELRPVGLVSIAVFPSGRRPCGSERNVAMVYVVGPNCGNTRKKGRRQQDNMSKDEFLEVIERVGGAIASAVRQYNDAAGAGGGGSGSSGGGGAAAAAPRAAAGGDSRRIDPEDGKARSWEETEALYRNRYRPAEIREYWRSTCRPVAASAGPPPGVQLPRVEVLRVCLLSGGVYKHPGASKVDVAAALIRGLLAEGGGAGGGSPSGGGDLPVLDFAFDEDCFREAWGRLGLATPPEEEEEEGEASG